MLNPFSGVHPYVKDRVRAILRVADRYGGQYTVTSGVRSRDKQSQLYMEGKTDTPPGCSQHQWGLAADVQFTGPYAQWWQDYYQRNARNLGLITVQNDPVHVQAIPGSTFRSLAVQAGVCHPQMSLETREWSECMVHAASHSVGHRHSCKVPCGGVYGIPCK